jgi:hypothetical protein
MGESAGSTSSHARADGIDVEGRFGMKTGHDDACPYSPRYRVAGASLCTLMKARHGAGTLSLTPR